LFRDSQGDVVDAAEGKYTGVIPTGLAKRTNYYVTQSIRRLTNGLVGVEFRILDFQLVR
jgi:hypothetical protein